METFYISRISKTASIRILKLSSGASSINSRGTFCNINFKTIGLIAIIYFDRKIYYRSKEKLRFSFNLFHRYYELQLSIHRPSRDFFDRRTWWKKKKRKELKRESNRMARSSRCQPTDSNCNSSRVTIGQKRSGRKLSAILDPPLPFFLRSFFVANYQCHVVLPRQNPFTTHRSLHDALMHATPHSPEKNL